MEEAWAEVQRIARRNRHPKRWLTRVYGPGNIETTRERKRRYYIKRKAERLGISVTRAAAMTPRQPRKARRGERVRNEDGSFVARGARPRGRSGAPTDDRVIDARSVRAAFRQRAIAMAEAAEGRSQQETHNR